MILRGQRRVTPSVAWRRFAGISVTSSVLRQQRSISVYRRQPWREERSCIRNTLTDSWGQTAGKPHTSLAQDRRPLGPRHKDNAARMAADREPRPVGPLPSSVVGSRAGCPSPEHGRPCRPALPCLPLAVVRGPPSTAAVRTAAACLVPGHQPKPSTWVCPRSVSKLPASTCWAETVHEHRSITEPVPQGRRIRSSTLSPTFRVRTTATTATPCSQSTLTGRGTAARRRGWLLHGGAAAPSPPRVGRPS